MRRRKIYRLRGELAGHILWTQAELDAPIPGEDREFGGNVLTYEPIGPNVPQLEDFLPKTVTVDIKRFIARRAGFSCEACSIGGGFVRSFDRWEYDRRSGIRTLKRLMCLCKQCHIASIRKLTRPITLLDPRDVQMRRSHGWTHEQLQDYFSERLVAFDEILPIPWRSDISILTRIALLGLPKPGERIIIRYPRIKVRPPADRVPVRYDSSGARSIYKVVDRPEDYEAQLAEARRLWPLIGEVTADEVAAKAGIDKFVLYRALGSRQAARKSARSAKKPRS